MNGIPAKKGQSGVEKLPSKRRKAVLYRLWLYLREMKMPLIFIGMVVVAGNRSGRPFSRAIRFM